MSISLQRTGNDVVISQSPRGAENPLLHQITQHVGAVRSLDVNPFQPNLLASGASESEIFIWDLNNPSAAMTPGNKMHPLEDISGVAWNRQVSGQGGREGGGGRCSKLILWLESCITQ